MCRTASVAMIDRNVPYVVPLSYGYELKEDSLVLYFHCAKEGRKLNILRCNDKVCFTIFNEGEPLYEENKSYERIIDSRRCYAKAIFHLFLCSCVIFCSFLNFLIIFLICIMKASYDFILQALFLAI